jgi:hypothetical protein
MITCRFNGRLGNNMFQIATSLSLAKQHNTEAIFDYTTWAGHRGEIPVDLSMFSYNFKRGNYQAVEAYNETHSSYNKIQTSNDVRLSGFYQSWKYFDDIRDELLNQYFQPSDTIVHSLSKYNISPNSLGISIRRGDYLMLQSNHCVLSTDYYQNAIDRYFLSNTEEIYIFSDDIEWCKNIFGSDVHYVSDTIGTQLFLMTKMQNLILSNSTFAWWGAYLNQNNGIVVAPDPWFGPDYLDKDTSDLYHPSWIRFKHNIVTHPFTITLNMYE